jgi:hypothetical protein
MPQRTWCQSTWSCLDCSPRPRIRNSKIQHLLHITVQNSKNRRGAGKQGNIVNEAPSAATRPHRALSPPPLVPPVTHYSHPTPFIAAAVRLGRSLQHEHDDLDLIQCNTSPGGELDPAAI